MKKSIYSILAAGAVVLAMAACSKEQDTQEGNTGVITESLLAEKESDLTKITLDGSTMNFGWSAGNDKASFTILNGSTYSFVDSDFYGATLPGKFMVSYTGTRQGYAVTPASFKGSYDGTNLVVNYPTSYDIAQMVDAGCYDNADGSHYIRFPMVATSTPGNNQLTFYAIGALAKVVVADVPKGTKNLYVTFNQKVTGDFTVSNPGTSNSKVTVSDTSTPSTVKVRISSAGLTAKHTITLYIPVPTTTNLSISASTETKATVSRNQGYAWAVEAISRVDASTDFLLDAKGDVFNLMFAPGNLYAYNEGGVVKYGLRNKYEQVITTMGANDNDPHQNGTASVPSVSTPGKYQDLFTWDEMYKIFTGESTVPSGPVDFGASAQITIDGVSYYAMNKNRFRDVACLTGHTGIRLKANTIEVDGRSSVVSGAVEIDLTGSPYIGYATYKSLDNLLHNDLVFGRFLFPDGYVDMTDCVSSGSTGTYSHKCSRITYDAYEAMVDAGAVFLVNGGAYNAVQGEYVSNGVHGLPYWLRQSETAGMAFSTLGSMGTSMDIFETERNAYYRSIRPTRDGGIIPAP